MGVRAGRYRVDAALMPGMAFAKPSQGETAAVYNAVVSDCIAGIAGTGGVETTVVSQERTETDLVTGDHEN